MEASWVLAVFLAAIASFISNLGVNLQKLHHIRTRVPSTAATTRSHSPTHLSSNKTSSTSHSHTLTVRAPSTSPTPSPAVSGEADTDADNDGAHYSSSILWRCGLLLIILGSLFDVAALALGPQSLIAPLGSLTLVSNIACAYCLLRERVSRYDIAATALIVMGSSIAIGWGKKDEVTYTVQELFGLYHQAEFITYATVVVLFSIWCYTQLHKLERLESDEGKESPLYLAHRSRHRFYYPALAGTIGAQSVLFAKCSVELLVNTFGSAQSNMFSEWPSYLVLAAMFGSIFLQIHYLNEGLRRFSSTYSIPVFQAFWILVSVVSGLIYYREWQGLDTVSCVMFTLGVCVTVSGVVMLSRRDMEDHHAAGHVKVGEGEEMVEVALQLGGGLAGEDSDEELELGGMSDSGSDDSDGDGEVEMSVLYVDKGAAGMTPGSGGGVSVSEEEKQKAGKDGVSGVEEKKEEAATIHIKPQSNNERGQDKQPLIPSRQLSPRMLPVAGVRVSSGGHRSPSVSLSKQK